MEIPLHPFSRTSFRQEEPHSDVDINFRLFSDEVFKTLGHYQTRGFSFNLSVAQKLGLKQIRDLINSKTIGLSVYDKGGEFVVIPHQLDTEITENHLQGDTLYRPSSEKEFKSQYRKLNMEWIRMVRLLGLKPSFISQLKNDLPTCPVLYLLIKTHKLVSTDELASTNPTRFKVRPIMCRRAYGEDNMFYKPNTHPVSQTCASSSLQHPNVSGPST